RQRRVDDEQPVALLDVTAAIDRPLEELARHRRRDRAGLALDIAEIASVIALDAEQAEQRLLPVAAGHQASGEQHDQDDEDRAFGPGFHDAPALSGVVSGFNACNIRSAWWRASALTSSFSAPIGSETRGHRAGDSTGAHTRGTAVPG